MKLIHFLLSLAWTNAFIFPMDCIKTFHFIFHHKILTFHMWRPFLDMNVYHNCGYNSPLKFVGTFNRTSLVTCVRINK